MSFDYACKAWFSNLTEMKILTSRITQQVHELLLIVRLNIKNLCKRVLQINWLKVHNRYLQFIVSDIFKYSEYFNEVFYPFGDKSVIKHSSNKKFKLIF